MFKEYISRRSFIKYLFTGFAALMAGWRYPKKIFAEPVSTGRPDRNIKGDHDLILAKGDDPYKMTVEAISKMGGMSRFVKSGSTVVVKPNMAWDRGPEYAANTNPLVVAALIELCYGAGAKRVNVFDRTCNSSERCYNNSGIMEIARKKGAKVYYVDDWNYITARFNYKSPMNGWPIYRDAIECDTLINVPVLKDHGLTNLTLSMKNLMGICGGNRGMIHSDIGRRLVDITDFIKPELTVIDAYRVLMAHGPQGGNLKDVVDMKSLIVATDPTLADTYAAKLAGRDPFSVPYIAEAAKRNFGSTDVAGADILQLTV